MLGELAWPARRPVWTATLVQLLADLQIEEQTARQAIARAAASGWIEPERQGREVRWAISDKLDRAFSSGAERVYSLSDPYPDWDGSWLSVLVTVPASQRQARRPLYAGLTWAGLGNPVPGLWLTPHVERAAEVSSLVEDHGLRPHTVAMVGSITAAGIPETEIVERGWDLDSLRDHYTEIEASLTRATPTADAATTTAYLRMVNEWQELPRTDPQLPEALLPDWIGRRVARRIEDLRADWAPAVRRRFAELER